MTHENTTNYVLETIPEERRVPLEGLYLNQNLRGLAEKLGSPVIAKNSKIQMTGGYFKNLLHKQM